MMRISTDLEMVRDGKIVVDAGGALVDLSLPRSMSAKHLFAGADGGLGSATLSRHGSMVQLVLHALTFEAFEVPAWSNVGQLPVGYRPLTNFRTAALSRDADFSTIVIELQSGGLIKTTRKPIPLSGDISLQVVFATSDPVPAMESAL